MKQAEWQLCGIVASIIIISPLPVVFISCSDQQRNPVEPSSTRPDVTNLIAAVSDETVECVVEKPLWAGAAHNDTDTGTRVGTVIVKNDSTALEVIYDIDEGYTLNEAHVYVGTSPPPKVAPGQFPNHSVPLSIPLSTFDAASEHTIYIAAYGEVCADGCEGAWAGGDEGTDYSFIDEGISKKWGWYFSYLQSCDEWDRLYRTAADMRALGTALGSYFVDHNMYPRTVGTSALATWPPGLCCSEYFDHEACEEELGTDPMGIIPSCRDGWDSRYEYRSDGDAYTLYSPGQDGVPGGDAEFDADIVFINGSFVAPVSLVN